MLLATFYWRGWSEGGGYRIRLRRKPVEIGFRKSLPLGPFTLRLNRSVLWCVMVWSFVTPVAVSRGSSTVPWVYVFHILLTYHPSPLPQTFRRKLVSLVQNDRTSNFISSFVRFSKGRSYPVSYRNEPFPLKSTWSTEGRFDSIVRRRFQRYRETTSV